MKLIFIECVQQKDTSIEKNNVLLVKAAYKLSGSVTAVIQNAYAKTGGR